MSIIIKNIMSGSIALLLLSACAKQETSELKLESMPPEKIYNSAEVMLKDKDRKDAALRFLEVERLYPYSEWAKRSLIMGAFSYHQAGLYEDSRGAAQRYIDFYPADEDAAYAQYLIALSYYDQIDDVSRDQGVTFQALQALRTTIERYPDSKYTSSALLKFDLALDHLAGKEMEIGRYYLKRGHFGAAINRFRVVVEDFQTTSHTPEALHRLVESYLSLGLLNDAQNAASILGHNFQGTRWYKDSYTLLKAKGIAAQGDVKSENWLSEIYRRVIKGEWL